MGRLGRSRSGMLLFACAVWDAFLSLPAFVFAFAFARAVACRSVWGCQNFCGCVGVFCCVRVVSYYIFGLRLGIQDTHSSVNDIAFGIRASVLCFADGMLLLFHVVLHGASLCMVAFGWGIDDIVFFHVYISLVVVRLSMLYVRLSRFLKSCSFSISKPWLLIFFA